MKHLFGKTLQAKFIRRFGTASPSPPNYGPLPTQMYSGFWSEVKSIFKPPSPPSYYGGPPKREVIISKVIGGICWFWTFYMMRKNGAKYLGFEDQFAGLYDLDYDKNYIPLARQTV